MVNHTWFRPRLQLVLGLLFALFYGLSYTSLADPNTAWITQLIGLVGFIYWVKDQPKHWYLIHLCAFSTLYWLYTPLHYFVGLPWSVSCFIVIFDILLLTAVKSIPMSYLTLHYPKHGMMLSAMYWTVFELAQIHIFSFPWILWEQLQGASPIPYILFPFPHWMWLVILFYLCERALTITPTSRVLWLTLSIFICIYRYPPLITPNLHIGVVQGNVDKISPSRASYMERYNCHEAYMQKYLHLSRSLPEVDLLIWPECILGSVFPKSLSDIKDYQSELHLPMPLILGASFTNKDHHNVALLLKRDDSHAIRIKKHAVPFAESTPEILIPIFKWLIPEFDFESHTPPNDYDIFTIRSHDKDVKVLAGICYEAAFLGFKSIPEVDVIVILSENIWFRSTTAQYQQLTFAQHIAKKKNKPVIMASNNGVTAWIDNHGILQNSIPTDTPGTLNIDWT